MFEHIQAVVQGSSQCTDAVLDLVKAIFNGFLPAWEEIECQPVDPTAQGGGQRVNHFTWRNVAAACIQVRHGHKLGRGHELVPQSARGRRAWGILACGARNGHVGQL
jgi:hypothetical protein